MTSRERALAALNHIEPEDRPCIDFGATLATGISAVVYHAAKHLLGLDRITTVEDIIAQDALIEPEMLEAMGGDFVYVRRYAPSLGIPVTGFKPSVLTNGVPCFQPTLYNPVANEKGDLVIYGLPHSQDYLHPFKAGDDENSYCAVPICRCPQGYHSFARMFHPMKGVETVEEMDEFVFPEMTQEEYDFYAKEAKRLRETTDKAVTGIFLGNVFELGQLYWGYEQFFVNLGVEEELTQAFLERRTDCLMRDLKKYLEATGKYIDVIQFNDDLGTQQSLLISKEMYRKYIKPHHQKMFRYVRDNFPNIKVYFHSCGAIFDIIPDLLDCGVQILNPVQISAVGMQPERLKREYGRELVFWGGIDTQNVLNHSRPDEIRRIVQDTLDILSPGGGYVFSQVHNVGGDVPPENLVACFQAAKNYRRKA